MAELDELEAALLEDPSDEALFAVYADALHAAGDPRGELAAIQRERARADHAGLEVAERELIAKHAVELLGLLGDDSPRPEAHSRHAGGSKRGFSGYTLTWRNGHVRSVTIQEPYGAVPGPSKVVKSLLERPAGRFVERIALEGYEGFASEVTSDASERHRHRGLNLVKAIAAAPRPALRSVSFGISDIPFDSDGEDNARDAVSHAGNDLGRLHGLWRAAPRLQHVLLSGGAAKLGPLELPELRSFEMRQSFMRRETLREIAAARAPKLESLVVWLGAGDYEVGYGADDLEPLCDPARFPALRHLGLVCSAHTHSVAYMVMRSPILPQLRSLDLRGGTMQDAKPFAAVDRWRHLEVLDLRWNALTTRDLPSPALLEPQRTWDPYVPRFNACQE